MSLGNGLAVDLMAGGGISQQAASYIGASNLTTITTAGTTQGTATAINASLTNVSLTTAGSQTGAILSATAPLMVAYNVRNSTATTGVLYPPTSGAFNAGSANAGINIAQGQSVVVWRVSTNAWVAYSTSEPNILSTANSWSETQTFVDIKGGDSSFGIAGADPATVSSAGGAIAIAAAIGGATTGAGGAVTIAGGAGTNGNSAGGAVTATGGAGQGTAAGGAVGIVGGASGAGATGNGGVASVTGGASLASNGNGGAVVITGGALAGSGKTGALIHRGAAMVVPQGVPAAKTVTAAITAAELVGGLITTTGATGPSIHQLPTGTLIDAELPGIATGDAFDFSIINTGTGASDDATITVNTDVTIIGNPTIGALTDATIISGSGRFRARRSAANTYVVYRLA